jgi:hypothetical protein
MNYNLYLQNIPIAKFSHFSIIDYLQRILIYRINLTNYSKIKYFRNLKKTAYTNYKELIFKKLT